MSLQSAPSDAGRKGSVPITAILVAIMVLCTLLAYRLTPRQFLADQGQKVVLQTMLPEQFGTWRVDTSLAPVVADPSANELIDRLYSDVLARTYVNNEGRRIMVTVAYGRDQSESMQVHTPEVCYPAQGFKVTKPERNTISIGVKDQPVVRLKATNGNRQEPITYWITMGNHVVNGGPRDRRDLRFTYGFEGLIPDGLLFRVSSIGPDVADEYETQRRFLTDLFTAVPPAVRDRLTGSQIY